MAFVRTEGSSQLPDKWKLKVDLHSIFSRRVAAWLLASLLVFGIGWVGYKGARVGLHAWYAYQNGVQILESVRSSPTPATLVALQPQVDALAISVGGIEAEMRIFAPLLRGVYGWTHYGSTVAATPELLTVGAELTALAATGLQMLGPALLAEDVSLVDAMGAALEQHRDQFPALGDRAARASAALLAIPAEQLHPALSDRLAQVQGLVPMLEPAVRAAPAFPDLLGMREPITYLLLFQNNHELRGTGGFISAAGELTLNRGQIEHLDIVDSYAIFSQEIEYSRTPGPIQKYLKADILVFRDANWSPDLPTSARTARYLYEQVRGVSVDGAVTVDLYAVQLLIDALDGIEVDGIEGMISGESVVDVIKELWGNPLTSDASLDNDRLDWWQQRKDFVPTLASAILNRIKSGDFNYLRVITAGQRAMSERAIQLWLDNREAATQLAGLGWDGALHPMGGADYLALVDSNVGFNKVNAVVTRRIHYRVEWPNGAGQPAVAVATLTYTHPAAGGEEICDHTPRYGDSYDDMIQRCFWNYVRLYVPRGSELISFDGVEPDSISSHRGEARTQVLAGFFSMKPGEEHTITLTYALPKTIQEESYRLRVQRQSGSGAVPFSWQIGAGERHEQIFTGNWMDWSAQE